jgi:two-component system phosphate regulon sensor histidine kinase PhoR
MGGLLSSCLYAEDAAEEILMISFSSSEMSWQSFVQNTTDLTLLLLLLLVVSAGWNFWFQLRLRRLKQAQAQDEQSFEEQNRFQSSDAPFRALSSPLFQALATSLDAGLIVVDTDRRVLFLNALASELLSIETPARENQGLISLVRDYQADALVSEVLRDHEAREMTIHPVSSNRRLHLRCGPVMADQLPIISGAILTIRDVTQLGILERARRDMVANVSHELRSPLSSLKLLVETLQSEPPPEVAQRMLDQMNHEIDSVTQLSNELRELSQIESGRVTLQLAPVAVKKVIESAIEHILPQARHKNIQIESVIPPDLHAVLIDERRIEQVIINLLHNAVKFTPEQGGITVRTCLLPVDEETPRLLSSQQQDSRIDILPFTKDVQHLYQYAFPGEDTGFDDCLVPTTHPPGLWMMLIIRDTGIGIPSQDLPRIFERFYKVDRSRTSSGGTGLGLAIAKHLIEGHGGRLWAESAEGLGSTFYFTLPLA